MVSVLLIVATIVSALWYNENTIENIVVRNWLMGTLRILPITFFVFFGFWIKELLKDCVGWGLAKRLLIVGILFLAQLSICLTWNELVDVQVFMLINPWLYFPKAIIGSFMILLASQAIHFDWLVFLGQKTKRTDDSALSAVLLYDCIELDI